jgi:hypothetical protein
MEGKTMTVSLTISETLDGSQINDSLAGGSQGLDLGSVTNGSYSGVISQVDNTGAQDLFIQHDATIDEITGLKVYIGEFSGTYGGARTAAGDIADLIALGAASGSSKNNADGNSSGLWLDCDASIDIGAVGNAGFDFATNGGGLGTDTVFIFGDNTTDGISEPTAFEIRSQAMVYNDGGETAASAPVDGSVGIAGDTVLGDAAHIRMRAYLADSFAEGGIYQWDYVFVYSFTA